MNVVVPENMADGKADSGSDSDSGEEPVVGNVNKFAVVPPGHSGRPRKGHLIFDACFESGNLGRVDYISDFEYDLFIRPDTCNPRFRVWFNFTVENVKTDQRVILNIVNFSKTKSLYRDGMSPMVKSTSRQKWTRIPTKHVYYYRCPDHRKNYVMSFAFCFDQEHDVYQFSYSFPYSYTRLQAYLDSIEKKNYNFFQRELLCLTVQQRRLELLTITHSRNMDPSETKKVVFITARVHPGESPSSYVCQGLIDFLVSNNAIAKTLREHLVFKIVPMLNPDGVYLGNYRCSLMGFDLNRHWQEPSPWAHPTVYATKNLLMETDRNEKFDMDFYIDIHAHSTLMNGFMYGNIYEDPERHERQAIFPKLLCANADDFSLANTNFNKDSVKAGTGRRTLGGCLDESALCYTLEVSFYSYMTQPSGIALPYTEDAYMKLGRNLARTFLDYYKWSGFVSTKPSSTLLPKASTGAGQTTAISTSQRQQQPKESRTVSEPIIRRSRLEDRLAQTRLDDRYMDQPQHDVSQHGHLSGVGGQSSERLRSEIDYSNTGVRRAMDYPRIDEGHSINFSNVGGRGHLVDYEAVVAGRGLDISRRGLPMDYRGRASASHNSSSTGSNGYTTTSVYLQDRDYGVRKQ